MTGLEAINDLWDRLEEVDCQMIEDWKIIKTALERKEKLEKVWEIVKDKKVDFNWLTYVMWNEGLEYYNSEQNVGSHKLTETEFNLLKEMLKWKD